MYILLGVETIIRIALAMLLLFIGVPALAWPKPRALGRLEWFWWNLGAGLLLLTLAGQLFTLVNIAGSLAYVALLAAIIMVCRARRAGLPPPRWIARSYRTAVLFALHTLDGRVSIRRRLARARRLARTRVPRLMRERGTAIAIWSAIIAVAAAFRLYRPFATANLGFSDTYVHLYLMRLLDVGRQVDPAWGPYPRGMHFLLLAIERLTNVDEILLMNFFGAFAGVLMTISAAYAAKRVARSDVAALVAGLLFATMIGGPHQYFALGGSVSSASAGAARSVLAKPYADLADAGEFDVLLTAFERQSSTLPQELAIAFLFPAALFFLDWLRDGNRWRLAGYTLCTAAIAAIHSGVLVPLLLLCGAAAIAAMIGRGTHPKAVLRGALAGAAGVAIGSTWMLGFIAYRHAGGAQTISANSRAGATALYYFPFLRPFVRGNATGIPEETAFMMFTPFLMAVLIVALLLALRAVRHADGAPLFWLSLATALFICTHAAPALGIPEIVEVRRNASWLAMSVAALIGVAVVTLRDAIAGYTPPALVRAIPALAIAAWLVTIPNLAGGFMRGKLLDYSGYGATTYAVLKMSSQLEPYTWTLVSYGQEYPMVLGRGFHLSGADFLEHYDPAENPLRIPTPYVFIAVEKKPHRFQINNWSARFDREAIEERLSTWCTLYHMTHRDMRVWLEDDNVRVYAIERRQKIAVLGAS